MIRLAILAALSAGCLRSTQYTCTTNAQCGTDGLCELDVGFCSFPDATCGRKFGDSAGALSNTCVSGMQHDAGIDARHTDGSVDGAVDGGTTCVGYAAIAGSAHRYKTIGMMMWPDAVTACMGSNTYLAIPDDMAENGQIGMLFTAGTYWIGIDDNASVLTVKNVAPTFTNWLPPNQPDTNGNNHCTEVAAVDPMKGKWDLTRCTDMKVAACECEP